DRARARHPHGGGAAGVRPRRRPRALPRALALVLRRVSLPPAAAQVLLAAYVAERIGELALSRRRLRAMHGRRLGAMRVRESGTRGGCRALVVVHAALLVLPPAEVILLGTRAPAAWLWIAIGAAAAAQGLRYWSIRTLGPRWNARAVVDARLGFVDR